MMAPLVAKIRLRVWPHTRPPAGLSMSLKTLRAGRGSFLANYRCACHIRFCADHGAVAPLAQERAARKLQ